MKNNLICAFGDSVMKGIVTDSHQDDEGKMKYRISSDGFVNKCEQLFGLKIFNYACFGSTTAQGKKYMERHLAEIQQSDYVVFEYGGNDCDYNWSKISENPDGQYLPNTTISDFVRYYSELITNVLKMNVVPVIMSMPLIDPDRFFLHLSNGLNRQNILKWLGGKTSNLYHWHERYNVELFKMASRLDVPIIDITSPFLEIKNYPDYICDDGIHPNEKGHQLIAETICNYGHRIVKTT